MNKIEGFLSQQNIENQLNLEFRINRISDLSKKFSALYDDLGYEQIPPVKISSGIDPTVRFIGSHISVFKPWLVEKKVPMSGIQMVQDCIRTKNLGRLLEDDFNPPYGSFFTSVGALAHPSKLKETCEHTIIFLMSLGIQKEDMNINVSSDDIDLLIAVDSLGIVKNIDTKPKEYYRHKIGVENQRGRNFNISIKNLRSGSFFDIGNIIILEDDSGIVGIETAIGTSVLIKQLDCLNNVQDSYPVAGLENVDSGFKYKFADTILVSLYLLREGLRPLGSDNRNRILKSYIKSLVYFRLKAYVSIGQLEKIITDFDVGMFGESSNLTASILVSFVEAFEKEAVTKKHKDFSTEDKKINELKLK